MRSAAISYWSGREIEPDLLLPKQMRCQLRHAPNVLV